MHSRPCLFIALALLACGDPPPAAPPDAGAAECTPASCPLPECAAGARVDVATRTCVAVGPTSCGPGFQPHPTGWGCIEVLPAADCPAGTMPVLGARDCRPVAAHPCAAGFVRAADGWGCEAVVPSAPCTGATRAALGSKTCVPVGDCAAPFPPAGATYFVDDSFTAAQLDANHFTTIGAALAAAPAGATIAVEEGVYRESLQPSRPATIAGRCAAKVRLEGAGEGGGRGLTLENVRGMKLTGLTITGFDRGAYVGNAELTVEDSVFEANYVRGLGMDGAGSHAVLRRCVVRKQRPLASGAGGHGVANETDTTLDIEDSELSDNVYTSVLGFGTVNLRRAVVMRSQLEAGGSSAGLYILGGQATVVESAIVANRSQGVVSAVAGTKVTVRDSTIADTEAPAGDERGSGAEAQLGGELVLERVSLLRHTGTAVRGFGAGARVTMTSCVVSGTKVSGKPGALGGAVLANDGAAVEVTDSAIVRSAGGSAAASDPPTTLAIQGSLLREGGLVVSKIGVGVTALAGASVKVSGSAVVQATSGGIYAGGKGSSVRADQTVVLDTRPQTDGTFGHGAEAEEGGLLELYGCAVLRSVEVGVLAGGEGTRARVDGSVVREGQPTPAKHTRGVGVGLTGGATLVLAGSTVDANREAGILVPEVAPPGRRSFLTMTDSVVASTAANGAGYFGRGLELVGGDAEIARSAIVASHTGGAFVLSAALRLEQSVIFGTLLTPGSGADGNAVSVFSGGLFTATGSQLSRSDGVGLVVQASRALVSASVISANAVGVHTAQASLVEREAGEPGANEVVVTPDSRLVGNATLTGTGELPLPDVAGQLPPASYP